MGAGRRHALDASIHDLAGVDVALNLDPAVERTRACRDRRARQGATTQRAPALKEEQRRVARRAWCARVRSALTSTVTLIEAGNFNSRAVCQGNPSGQLPDQG